MSEEGEDEEEKGTELGDFSPAVKAVKEATAKDGFLTRLYMDRFSPSQQLRGKDAAERVKDELEKRKKARRQKNLETHFERLKDDRGNVEAEISDSTEAEQLAFDWFQGVQDVDPSDQELSAFWYGVLKSITQEKSWSKLLMEELKRTSSEEIALLISARELPEAPALLRNFLGLDSEIKIARDGPFAEKLLSQLESRGFLHRVSLLSIFGVKPTTGLYFRLSTLGHHIEEISRLELEKLRKRTLDRSNESS